MSLAIHHSPIPFARSEIGLERAFARLRSLYQRWGAARLNRALAAELTDEQLADSGLYRTTVTGRVPVIEVPASVMAELSPCADRRIRRPPVSF